MMSSILLALKENVRDTGLSSADFCYFDKN